MPLGGLTALHGRRQMDRPAHRSMIIPAGALDLESVEEVYCSFCVLIPVESGLIIGSCTKTAGGCFAVHQNSGGLCRLTLKLAPLVHQFFISIFS